MHTWWHIGATGVLIGWGIAGCGSPAKRQGNATSELDLATDSVCTDVGADGIYPATGSGAFEAQAKEWQDAERQAMEAVAAEFQGARMSLTEMPSSVTPTSVPTLARLIANVHTVWGGLDWTDLDNGCESRAHLMASRLESTFPAPHGKVFVTGALHNPLRSKVSCSSWSYHVAPVVLVAVDDSSTKLELRVIDPSLAVHAQANWAKRDDSDDRTNSVMTLREWIRRTANSTSGDLSIEFANRAQFYPRTNKEGSIYSRPDSFNAAMTQRWLKIVPMQTCACEFAKAREHADGNFDSHSVFVRKLMDSRFGWLWASFEGDRYRHPVDHESHKKLLREALAKHEAVNIAFDARGVVVSVGGAASSNVANADPAKCAPTRTTCVGF